MQFNYNYTKHKFIFFGISIALILAGLISMLFVNHLKPDIEFQGGTVINAKIGKIFNNSDIEKMVKKVTGVTPVVQAAGISKDEALIKIAKEISYEETKVIKSKLVSALQEKYNVKKVPMTLENTSASIGKEAKQSAVIAVIVACLLMLIYITFRFEFKTGTAAVIALVHDVLIMLGVYSIFDLPINSAFIAAALTIIGYSINDTIVVFDRIRENISKRPKEDLEKITNDSINETLLRSINTVVTVLIALVILYFIGVKSIKDFAFPLIIGVTSGAYSSIFIASPLWLVWRQSEDKKAVIK